MNVTVVRPWMLTVVAIAIWAAALWSCSTSAHAAPQEQPEFHIAQTCHWLSQAAEAIQEVRLAEPSLSLEEFVNDRLPLLTEPFVHDLLHGQIPGGGAAPTAPEGLLPRIASGVWNQFAPGVAPENVNFILFNQCLIFEFHRLEAERWDEEEVRT